MKKLILAAVVFASTFQASANTSIPQECYDRINLAKYETFEEPTHGPKIVIQSNQYGCWLSEPVVVNGYTNYNYKHYPGVIKTYWIPGTQLPPYIRGMVDKKFEDKIVELKGRDQFSEVLSHLISHVAQSQFPHVYGLLARSGFIDNPQSKTGAIVKKAVMDVLLNIEARSENINKAELSLDAIIYYGLTKGQEFGVIDSNLDVDAKTSEMVYAIRAYDNYNERYTALSSKIDSLNCSVFK